jgi:RNA polymerase sigma-70 factor (ECF subfamily)
MERRAPSTTRSFNSGPQRHAQQEGSMSRELVEEAQQGDREAFETLATRVVRRLYTAANAILREPDLADDAVQRTLIDVWRNLRALRDPDAFDAWAHRILVHRCYSAARDRRRHAEVRNIDLDPAVASHERRVETLDAIERAFRRLTPDQRAVLVLHHRLGFNDAEAGAILGIPEGTVKSRLNRAHTSLRASIDADARDVVAVKGQTA